MDPADTAALGALARLRLASLRADPAVLFGDLVAETGRDPQAWRRAAGDGTWFVAWSGDEPVGLARLRAYPDEEPALHLESMWVVPGKRRLGVGRALVHEVEELARAGAAEAVGLWVVADNPSAVKLYEELGYRRSLRSGRLPDGREETEYVKALAATGDSPEGRSQVRPRTDVLS